MAANRPVPLRDTRDGEPEHDAAVVMIAPPLLDGRGDGRGDGHAAHGIHWGAVLVLDPGIHLSWGCDG